MVRVLLTVLSFTCSTALFAAPPLIEMKGHEGEIWQGKSVVHDEQTCWLEQPDGQLKRIELKDVAAFRKVGPAFQPASSLEIRTDLMAEFGRKYEVVAGGQYVVVAAPGQARRYADLFDGVYRSYWQHFSRRKFSLTRPDYPLVAIVFATEAEFASYAFRDNLAVSPTLKGYYHPRSNRIAFFDPPAAKKVAMIPHTRRSSARDLLNSAVPGSFTRLDAAEPLEVLGAATGESGETGNTLVHEAIHQLAFNTGLHSRLAETPRWVVEGLAMMFEVELSKEAPKGPRGGKINSARLEWFRKGLKSRTIRLERLVTDDEPLFAASPLDVYAEAWCASYFLSETRSTEFVKFLKLIAANDIWQEYGSELRLKQFQECFGKDVSRLEVDMLRFIDDL